MLYVLYTNGNLIQLPHRCYTDKGGGIFWSHADRDPDWTKGKTTHLDVAYIGWQRPEVLHVTQPGVDSIAQAAEIAAAGIESISVYKHRRVLAKLKRKLARYDARSHCWK